MPNVKKAYVRIAIFDADGVVLHQSGEINQEILEVIEDLGQKGIKCYLATNLEKDRIDYLRDKLNLKHWFNGIFSASDLGSLKPEKQFFERMLKRIDPKKELAGQEILFWDDAEENVAAAKALKLQAYQFIGEENFNEIMDQVTFVSPRFLHKRK